MRHIGLSALILCAPGQAWSQTDTEWSIRKCALYTDAWQVAEQALGTAGLGTAFLANHAAFLASGCSRPHDVCPQSPAERDMANLLTVMSMNEGMASTFVPFACLD